MRDDVAADEDPAARVDDALIELGVLVGGGARVEEADALEDTAAEGAEPHGVDEPVLGGRVVLGAAGTEGAAQRRGYAALEEGARLEAGRAARVVGAALVEGLDAAGDEVGRVGGPHVHADDDVAPRPADARVQPRGGEALGVVDEVDARVDRGVAHQDLARRVEAHPVGHEDLEAVARPVLGADGLKERFDVLLLVEAGHGDGHEGLNHGGPQYKAQAARFSTRFSSQLVTADHVSEGASRPTSRSMWPSGNAL